MLNGSSGEVVRELFEEYSDDVYRYAAWMLRDSQEAEDVTQEVFLKVMRSWGSFRGNASVRTWLWSIVRNTVADEIRRRGRFRSWLRSVEMDQASSLVGATETLGLSEMEGDILELSIPQRQVVLFRIIHGLSTKETATVLGWSDSKVRTTLHRAIKRLRLRMVGEETMEGGYYHE